ncbi:hypothetical protein GWI33_000166 [Rhynchophorus ferrugineus]|uniref:Uncharacterized protein n=1 Tax=Rhynchophorus ferrugineus TaxID=354439 RepID=A0A834IX37_RHYFE|nr:hypothetical protein GWI33_000166 [Rhynchophorus ferrugineus]
MAEKVLHFGQVVSGLTPLDTFFAYKDCIVLICNNSGNDNQKIGTKSNLSVSICGSRGTTDAGGNPIDVAFSGGICWDVQKRKEARDGARQEIMSKH